MPLGAFCDECHLLKYLLAEHGARPIHDDLHERVELDAVGVHDVLSVVVLGRHRVGLWQHAP